MLLNEIIDGLLKKDSYEIFLWLSFLSTKIDCKDCIEVCKEKNRMPRCDQCVPAKHLIKKLNPEKGEKNNGIKNQERS